MASLSEAQKDAGTLAALRRRRLTAGPGSARGFTKLGLAVRQHLMEPGK